jgi:hypothetical protein
MAKTQPPQILTAHRLRTGDVVYWQNGGWTEQLAQADIFPDPTQAEAALGRARQFVTDRLVVNPYLFAVEVGERGPVPVEEREIIRAAGPTVRTDTGKQAQQARHV